MPYKITSVGGGKYKVTSPHGTKAKRTSKKKAVEQVQLLGMKEHGVVPKGGWKK